MAEEVWKTIPKWPDYEVSTHGRVRRATPYRSTQVGRILKPYLLKGYPAVMFRRERVRKHVRIHQLVAEVFIGPCPAGKEVNHKDGCVTNNHDTNLEYMTPRENMEHAIANGLTASGDRNPRRLYPERYPTGKERAARRRPDAARGERNGTHTHPEKVRRGSEHGRAKLTEDDVQQIKQLIAQGHQLTKIAERFGVSISTISLIKHGRKWKHVPS